MAKKTKAKKTPGRVMIDGKKTRLGKNILKGRWLLVSPHKLEFSATHISTINVGDNRLVVFKVANK